MITINLTAHAEKLAEQHQIAKYRDSKPLLYHQVRTYQALETASLVMNTYPTGTGKTTAALTRLLPPDQQEYNTLLIAPTNALIEQHVEDTRSFIAANQLDLRVLPVNAATVRDLSPELRRGEVLQRLIANPLTFSQQLGLPDDAEKLPFVAVTNPDIFYLALYFRYGRLDQRNVWGKFIRRFRYIVIDEFHYYDNKQFANFLFFFALWREWGYLKKGHKICLLSATPRDAVYRYLNTLFEPTGWVRVGPDNEPAASATLPTTPTLSPLALTVVGDTVENWATAHRTAIEQWQNDELDAAIISSSLGQINRVNQTLRHLQPARITGPEPAAQRRTVRPLILATPTVDIGYNFGRPGKTRQSIDRLVCDAKFGDELTQRIGRAGRVLGRAQTTQPSAGVVLVSDDALGELRAYDGQTLTREQWATIVHGLRHLPPKHRLEGYIRTHAIKESFYPLFKLYELTPQDEQERDTLFDTVCAMFAPNTKQTIKGLNRFFREYEKRRIWLRTSEAEKWRTSGRDGDDLAGHFATYMSWRESSKNQDVRIKAAHIRPALAVLLAKHSEQKQEVLAFIQSQVAVTNALFNFREAWQGPVAAVHDPHHLLSSETLNRYDLFHLYGNYELHLFPSKAAFERECGATTEADFYVSLRSFRADPLTLGFDYVSPWDEREEFEWRCCRAVIGLQGLTLTARERGSLQPIALPSAIRLAVAEQWIPCLIVGPESVGALVGVLRGSPFYRRDLVVDFGDTVETYAIVTGSAAFHVVSDLKRHFLMVDKKLSEEAIFL